MQSRQIMMIISSLLNSFYLSGEFERDRNELLHTARSLVTVREPIASAGRLINLEERKKREKMNFEFNPPLT